VPVIAHSSGGNSVAADFGSHRPADRHSPYSNLPHLLRGVAATANRVLAEKAVLNGEHQSRGVSVSVFEIHNNAQTHLDSEPPRQNRGRITPWNMIGNEQ
jgi:hypothetical protein